MADKVIITKSKITNIANAIRTAAGLSTDKSLTLDEMITYIKKLGYAPSPEIRFTANTLLFINYNKGTLYYRAEEDDDYIALPCSDLTYYARIDVSDLDSGTASAYVENAQGYGKTSLVATYTWATDNSDSGITEDDIDDIIPNLPSADD